MCSSSKASKRLTLLSLLSLLGLPAVAEYGTNFPAPATDVAQDIFDLHMLTMSVATLLLVITFLFVFYSLFTHRKSRGYKPDLKFHNTWFGHWSWVIVPLLVFGVDLTIAGNANPVLERLWKIPEGTDILDVKVTGHQWWWEFDYLDAGVKVESRFTPQEEAEEHYLRDVDNRLILPTNTKIRFLHTSADVIHALWIPALAVKKDAIPGYISETWVEINREGVFRGQCAEICGTWHSRMPVVVEAVSPEKFEAWLKEKKVAEAEAIREAESDRIWSKDELMARGKAEYEVICVACHQQNGLGIPPAFPPLSGSAVVQGPLDAHFQVVLNGRPGTAMVSWRGLNDLQIASIITYERNSWDNHTGDVVQPADIKGAR